MFKKTLLVVLALTLLIGTCACQPNAEDPSVTTTTADGDVVTTTTVSGSTDSSTTTGSTDESQSTGNTQTSSTTKTPVQTTDSKFPKVENLTNKTVKLMLHGEFGDDDLKQYIKDAYGLTVETDIVASDNMLTKFISQCMTHNPPDLYPAFYKPSLYNSGYVVPWDDMVDLDHEIWKDVKPSVEQYKWNGHIYTLSYKFERYAYVYYNKALFDEAGEDYPADLYRSGKWDWDTFARLTKDLTQDPQNTGTPSVYGACIAEGEYLMYTTGTHFVTFDDKGELSNNMKSAGVARAMNFYYDLAKTGSLYLDNDPRGAFAQGQIAMLVGHMWYIGYFKDLTKNNELGMAPLPKDPAADTTYTLSDPAGYCLSKDAANPQGALALMHACRAYYGDEEVQKKGNEKNKADGILNDSLIADIALNETVEKDLPPLWGAFTFQAYAGDIWNGWKNGEPWATVAARIYPQLQFEIEQAKDSMAQDEVG